MQKQNENIEKLIQLTKDNPEIEIVPMVNYEVCCGDEFRYWLGSWGEPRLDEIYRTEDYIYFKSTNYDHLIDNAMDDIDFSDEALTDEEMEKKAKERVNGYKWEKCIAIYIDLP